MNTHFVDNASNRLVLFFCGWGCDQNSYLPLVDSDYDTLFVFDYDVTGLKLDFDFSKYTEISLIAFSFGVYVASVVQNLPVCGVKVAVNGTLTPIDDDFGIPEKVFNLMLNGMDEASIPKFRKKLFSSESHLEKFTQNSSQRTFGSFTKELHDLSELYKEHKNPAFHFDKILIAQRDCIIPTKNQLRAWHGHKNIIEIDAAHFPFYCFEKISDIIFL